MGVKDLWQLLSPIGRRVSIETLEGKTLAIDASIWITQFIKAMRDEEGKMMKNAHLIGTLRRVLKLLFHRIRPLFVFDGATPLLKLRTVQARRKGHEKQEESKKIAAQRLLRAQLKQYALKAVKPSTATSKEDETTTGSYVSTFKQPAKPSNSSASRSAEGRGGTAVEGDKADDDVEWVDGYEGLNAKDLDATSGGQTGGGEEPEMEWQLPEDSDDLSPEALAALPAHIRKSLIEEARRRQRMESRAHYLPVAGNPALYSQTQLSNFLSSSKLNRKFADAHQSIQNVLVGTSIAAEGKKKYQFISRFSLLGNEGSSNALSNSNTGDQAAATMDSDDEAGSYWEPAGFSEPEASEDIKRIVREDSAVPARLNAGKFAHDVDGGDEDAVNLALAISASLSDFEVAIATGAAGPSEAHHLEERVSDAVDEVVEEENEDVAWESGEESQSESALGSDDAECWDGKGGAAEVESKEEVLGQFGSPKRAEGGLGRSSARSGAVEKSAKGVERPLPLTFGATARSGTGGSDLAHEAGSDFDMSSEALTRAVTTASSMADWAGRAVRSALKEHVRTTTQQSQQNSASAKPFVHVASPIITEKLIRDGACAPVEPGTNRVPDTPMFAAEEDTVAAANPVAAVYVKDSMDMSAEEVYAETRDARRKFNAAMRDTETLTDEMRAEVIELLQALNLPYLVAPYEAEAQCAVLEQLGLVDGVVTEDSDALLFGANTVYKNIFNDKKYVEVYLAEDARREMGLHREDLVALAYFLGSDYCEGVTGVGIVNAVEIIHAFPMQQQQGSSSGDVVQVGAGPLRGLRQFKDWLHGFDLEQELRVTSKAGVKEDSSDEKLIAFTEKHKHGRSRWTVPASFPDPLVARAYLSPQADSSPERFAWTVPDVRSVRSFCSDRLGWTEAQMDMAIDPVLRRYAERSHQPRIDAHFLTYHGDTRFAKIASDRLREAVVQITGKRTNLALGGSAPNTTSLKRPKPKGKKVTESQL